MATPAGPDTDGGGGAAGYDARWGYRTIDPWRYETRRYGSVVRRLNLRLLEWALTRALRDVRAGSRVLDLPCGAGVLGRVLGRLSLRVVGADISPAMLRAAGQRGTGTSLVRADAERLPFKRGGFDAIVCNRFLMHLPSETRVRVLAELATATRGPLVLSVCHPYTYKATSRALRRALGRRVKRSPRLTGRELRRELAAAGLTATRILSVVPIFSEVWIVVAEPVARTRADA